VRFFDELTRLKQDPLLNYDLLELQHTCLALGFQGIHSYLGGAASLALQQIQRDLYETFAPGSPQGVSRAIAALAGPESWLCAHRGYCCHGGLYWVSRACFCSEPIFVFCTGSAGGADIAANNVASLMGKRQVEPSSAKSRKTPVPLRRLFRRPRPDVITQLQRICNAMAPEVAAQKVVAEQTANQITIRIGNVLLFNSGVATVLDQFRRFGERIAATLEKEDGYIKVIGTYR